jgi:hypothetical protein
MLNELDELHVAGVADGVCERMLAHFNCHAYTFFHRSSEVKRV